MDGFISSNNFISMLYSCNFVMNVVILVYGIYKKSVVKNNNN